MMFPAGELAFWLGDTARAIRAMTPMTVKLPRHHLMLGQAYEKEGNVAAARDAYRRIVESPVLSLELRIGAGVLWREERLERALKPVV